MTTAQDPVWKSRWQCLQVAGVGANRNGVGGGSVAAAAAVQQPRVAGARPMLPARRPTPLVRTGSAGSVSAKATLAKPIAAVGLTPSMAPSALAHAAREAAASSLLPPTLPATSPYRYMVLAALRNESEGKFHTWAAKRTKSPQATLIHKPVAEHLQISSMQLRVGVAKSATLSAFLPVVLLDQSCVATFRPGAGLDLKRVREVSVLLFSGKLMKGIPLHASAPVKQSEREWGLLRAGRNEGELSLVEWRIKGSNAHSARVQLETASESPFEPNAARRALAAAAAAASKPPPAHDGSLPIPGLHLRILAGVSTLR